MFTFPVFCVEGDQARGVHLRQDVVQGRYTPPHIYIGTERQSHSNKLTTF